MKNYRPWLFGLTLVLGLSPFAIHASSVRLVPTSSTTGLGNGDMVTFDVVMDFSDVNGTLGGGLDVAFDSIALGFVSANRAGVGDEDFSRDPDELPNLLESWAIGDFNPLSVAGPVVLGTVQFEVLPAMPNVAYVIIGGTSSVGGPWVSGVDYVSLLSPQYNQILLTRLSDLFFKDGFEDL